MAWTEKQKDAIESRNESLLVSAAAGSGKTSVLVERVTGLLKEGCDLNRMLIVTFTNAAAAEMKERIAQSLGYGVVRHSHISTFHKFAIDVIRRYYQIINIDPAFSICDEYNQSVLKNEAMDEMFEELFEKEDENFQDFLNHYATAKSNSNAKELILYLHTFLQSLPNPEDFLSSMEDGNAIDIDAFLRFAQSVLKEEIRKAVYYNTELTELLENPLTDGALPMPKLSEKLKTDRSGLMEIADLLERNDIEAAAGKLSEFSFVRFVKTKEEKASYELIADRADALRDKIKDIISGAKDNFKGIGREKLELEISITKKPLSQLSSLCRDFDSRFSKKKRAKGLLDFSDIEHFALKILEDEEVCGELRDSFDWIFVDEYQDSNLVQDELINRIARKDNVFLVGDVKQSIYKFRLAEPELFISRYERYKGGQAEKARCIDLSNNFRSKGPVIDFINKSFEMLMNRETVGIAYDDDAKLYEGAPYTGNLVYKPRLYLVSQNSDEDEQLDEDIEELKAAELEALEAARIIREYYGKPIYDSKKKTERPLEYSDMVILLRSAKSKGEVFYQALENCDIPVYIERNEGYFDTPEIQFFLNFLRIIDNYRQDVPLISVLHFPLFGFSADELAEIRINAGKEGKGKFPFSSAFKLYSVKGENDELRKKAADFLKKLSLWRKKASLMPLSDFVWELMTHTGLDLFSKALPSGSQRFANLRTLADKAQSYEEENAGGLYGFISYIDAACEKGKSIETGQVSMLGEGADAVRIMTIHKSKGLEFPFVLLSGLGSRFMSSKNRLHIGLHKDFGASIRVTDPLKDIYSDPAGLGIINLKKEKEEFAETIRVLYVAMTRAKDILVMSSVCRDAASVLKADKKLLAGDPQGAKSYLEMLLPVLDTDQISFVSKKELMMSITEGNTKSSDIISKLESGFDVDETKLPLSPEEIRERLYFDYSPKEEDLLKSKYSVSEIAALSREKENTVKQEYNVSGRVPKFIKDMPLDAAAKGTAYHTVMAHIPFTRENKTVSEIKEFIRSLAERKILDPLLVDAVEPEKIAGFFASDLGKRVSLAKEVYKESPFVLKSTFEGREVFVQGTIDCFFEENGEYVLIDYKSNYIDERNIEREKERLREDYLPQLKLYKEALEKINHVKVKEACVYLFGINETITVC